MNHARLRILTDLSRPDAWTRATDGSFIIERSPLYWAADGSGSRSTYNRELHAVASLLALTKVSTGDAVALGFTRRPGRAATYWRSERRNPWAEARWLSGDKSASNVELIHEWTLQPSKGGHGPWPVRCPSQDHTDSHPSAIANPPRPGYAQGLVWCLTCGRHTGFCKVDSAGLWTSSGDVVTYRKGRPPIDPDGAPGPWRSHLGTKPVHLRVTIGAQRAQRTPTRIRDLGQALRSAQKRLNVDAAWDLARQGSFVWTGEDRPPVADTLITLEPHTWDTTIVRELPTGGRILIPEDPRPACSTWVLLDIDDIRKTPFSTSWMASVGEDMRLWASQHPELSGRVCLVRTSETGVQLVLELKLARWRPKDWARGNLASIHDKAGAHALWRLSRHGATGGHLDPASVASGRCVRLPGPRISMNGDPWVAQLVFAS